MMSPRIHNTVKTVQTNPTDMYICKLNDIRVAITQDMGSILSKAALRVENKNKHKTRESVLPCFVFIF